MVRNHQFVTILNVINIIIAYCAINSICPNVISNLLFITNPLHHHRHHYGRTTILVAEAATLAAAAAATTSNNIIPNSAFTSTTTTTNQNITTAVSAIQSNHPPPPPVKSRYRTLYACEDRQLQIDCDEGTRINLIRANYGRFSISICNEQGHLDWSIDCMSPISFRIMVERCNMQRKCAVNASSLIFGDKCPKTRKYLEVHFQCQDIPQQQQQQQPITLLNQQQQPHAQQISINLADQQQIIKSDFEQQQQQQTPLFRPDPTINLPNQTPIRVNTIPSSHNVYQPVPQININAPNYIGPTDRTTMQDNPRQLSTPPTNTSPPNNNLLVISPQTLEELYQNLHLSIPAPMDTLSLFNGSEPYPFDTTFSDKQQQQATAHQGTQTFINSEVMSLSMMGPKEKPIILSEPVLIILRHIRKENITNPRCVLWDQQRKDWTTQGCQHLETNITHTSCACDQLTYYSVVMDLEATTSTGQQSTLAVLNSEVMSLSMMGPIERPIILADPVLITMRHLQQDNMTNPRCVLWDQQRKDWTGQGCQHIETNTTHTSCACDQLTYYAVLMDMNIHASTTMPLAYLSHDPIWRTMTFCSFIIASVCLSITLITLLFMVRQQRRLANQRKQQRNNNYYYGASSYYQQQQKLSSASTSNNNTIYAPQQRANAQTISKQQEQSDYGHQKDQQKSSYTVINNYNNTSTGLIEDFMSSFSAINNNSASLFENSACLINGNNIGSSTTHQQLHKDCASEIRMIIYKNLCLTILLVEFLYLVSVNHYNHHRLYCHVVSRLMHFALMATFMWCLIEAHEMHKSLKSFIKSTTAISDYKHNHHHHRNQQANKLTSLLSNHQQQSSSPNPCLVVSGNQSHDISLMQHMLQLQQQKQQIDSPSAGSPTSSQDTNATTATLPDPANNNTATGPVPLIRGIMNCNSPSGDIQQSNAYWLNKNDVSYSTTSNISSWTTKRSRYMHLIAYAIPCMIVCITSFVTPQVYYYGPTSQPQQPLLINHCWLAASSYGGATVFTGQKLMSLAMAPMLLLLVATATYLVMSVYLINKYNRQMNGYVGNGGGNLTSGLITTNHMTLTLKKQCDRKRFNDIRVWLKKTILLVLLVALTWTLALPYLIDSNNISLSQQYSINSGLFQQQLLTSGRGLPFLAKSSNYNQQRSVAITALLTLIFACANALMGIFIFTTQCLQSNHVRHQYMLLFQRFSLARFFMKLSLAPDSSSPSTKYPGNNGSTCVQSNGGTSSHHSSYSSGTLSGGIGRHPMAGHHTLASLRNGALSHQQHHLANAFSSSQQQQLAASAAYLNNQIGEASLEGQNNLIDGAQSCQLSPVQQGNNAILGYNPTQVTSGLSNGNKLFFQQQQQQIYGLHHSNHSADNHYQANQNSSMVSPMVNVASQSISTVVSNDGQNQQLQHKGYHLTDEQSLSSSDYGCRRLTGQGISQQFEGANNNGTTGAATAHDLSLLLSNSSHHQKDLYGEALALQQLSMSSPNSGQFEVQNIIQQLLARQQQQHQQRSVSSKGLIQEHIYECIDDDNPYIAKLLLPTLYGQLSPEQQARAVATLARQLELGTTAVSPSSSFTQTMGGRGSQQNHNQQMQHMHQRSTTTSPRALALASKIIKSAVQQSALATGQNLQHQQLQPPASQNGQQRHFALPAIVRDNQKTNVICSKSTQQTTIGPQVATAINCNNNTTTNNQQQQRLQQAQDIMAIYNSSSSTGGSASSNGNVPFSYGRSAKLSTDC